MESVCAVKLVELDGKDRLQVLLKLHRQFTHPPEKKLIALLKDTRVWHDDYKVQLGEIYNKCELCKVYKKTPSKPAVALPVATRFNQKVCMDLKKKGDKWILHLIDMFSRLSISAFIIRKRPSDVIDKIVTSWVGAGFGVMEATLTDNGGEFNADEIREVASILYVEVLTTAAYSPFQNELCECNHAVVDMMLMKFREQCPKTEIGMLLVWLNVAKNSLQMWHGFSSYKRDGHDRWLGPGKVIFQDGKVVFVRHGGILSGSRLIGF